MQSALCRAQHGEMFAVIINNPIFQVRKPRLRKEDVSLPELTTEWAVPSQKLTSLVSSHCSADQLFLITKIPDIMSLIYIFCLVPQKVLSSTWQRCTQVMTFLKVKKLGSGEGKVMWRKGTGVTKSSKSHTICLRWASNLALRFSKANTKQRKIPVYSPLEHLVIEMSQPCVRR